MFWTAFIGVFAYVLAVEPLFFSYVMLQVLILTVLIQRQWVKFCIHPDSPWVRAKINSNADRIATQLLNEINGTQGKSDNNGNSGGPPVA